MVIVWELRKTTFAIGITWKRWKGVRMFGGMHGMAGVAHLNSEFVSACQWQTRRISVYCLAIHMSYHRLHYIIYAPAQRDTNFHRRALIRALGSCWWWWIEKHFQRTNFMSVWQPRFDYTFDLADADTGSCVMNKFVYWAWRLWSSMGNELRWSMSNVSFVAYHFTTEGGLALHCMLEFWYYKHNLYSSENSCNNLTLW